MATHHSFATGMRLYPERRDAIMSAPIGRDRPFRAECAGHDNSTVELCAPPAPQMRKGAGAPSCTAPDATVARRGQAALAATLRTASDNISRETPEAMK